MRRRGLLALVCAPWLLGAGPDPVDYTLRPQLAGGRLDHLQVEVRFGGDADGVTEVRLPDRFGSETELHRQLFDFGATGAQLARPEPARLRLQHRPGAAITLSYRVRNGRGPGAVVDYRPDLNAAGFTVLGETVFAWPVGRLSGAARARLVGQPAGWTAATDLERAATTQEVLESVTTAGRDVRLAVRSTPAGALTVAARGRFRFTVGEFADVLSRVLAAQRAVHGEPAGPFLAVVQGLPEDLGRFTRDGVGRGDAAAYFISSDEYLEMSERIIAHEPVHAWLPRKVGGLPPGPAEPGGYWFSEGFADFVGLRSLVRADLSTLDGYAASLNARLHPDAKASDPAVPNRAIVAGYGRDESRRDLPYVRGHSLALLWDSRLRSATGGRLGVDDVLTAMRRRKAAAGLTADQLFPRVYREMGGPDLSADLAAHVRDGRPIVWPRTLYDGCLQIESAPIWRLDEDLRDAPGAAGRRFAVKPQLAGAELARCRRLLAGE